MDTTAALLREMIELQKATIRLQKFSIVLQAEALAYQSTAVRGGKPNPALDKIVVRAVQQMRKTVDRVAAGKGLLK